MKNSIKLIKLLNLWLDSHQSCTAILLGQSKEFIFLVTLTFLIFKVTVLYVGYLLNQCMDFLQTYMAVPLGHA